MSPEPTTPPGAPPGTPKGKQSLSSWLKTHKYEAALGAGGSVVALALYAKSRANAAGSSSSSSPTGTTTPTGTADTTGTDVYNGLEDQILGLQNAVLGLGSAGSGAGSSSSSSTAPSAPAATAPTSPYSNETQQGSGYGPGNGSAVDIPGLGGGEFAPIFSGDAAGAILRSGGTLDFQPSEGNFQPDTAGSNLLPGTPLFQQVG